MPDLTLQEAADHLGVHYMTAYRYVRLGLLPAEKIGSIWRVRSEDVDELLAGPSEPRPASEGSGRRRAPWAERLEARLVAGDARGAWGVVEAALAAGAELDEVYLDVLSPAMVSIGTRWAAGELDIAVEHRATGIAMRIVGRLGPRFARRGRTRGGVVLGTPAGEQHSLPVAILADLVRGAGFEVSDLGADVPADSFVRTALDTPRLVAVGVSVTSPVRLESAAVTIAALHEALGERVPVLVGGGALTSEEDAREVGADAWARDGRSLVGLLEATVAGSAREGKKATG